MSLVGLCRPCRQHLIKNLAIRPLYTVDASTSTDPSGPPPAASPSTALDPTTVSTPREERTLLRTTGLFPIASRRRRAALKSSDNVPFEQLPYQCFQEARKLLQQDRQEKIVLIERERARIQRLKEQQPTDRTAARQKEIRLGSMRRHLEWLKIQADINDPMVKRRFEDGKGDMSRPIYRHLAQRKWSARKKLIIEQRVTQMHVVPDVIPSVDITADVDLYFHGIKDEASKSIIPRAEGVPSRAVAVQPGEFVASKVSENAPRLNVQVFDKGDRLVTVAIVDPDVPNLEKDSFDSRGHFLAVNVPISPTMTSITLDKLSAESQVILPWFPPSSQKGAPYHRVAVLVFKQPDGVAIDVAEAAKKVKRNGFYMRSFATRHALEPFAAHLFRTRWDEWMADVMERAGIPGADLEFKTRRIEPLPYKRKDSKRFR